jgi:glycosyltransferase involved in cell wall biosynthesis
MTGLIVHEWISRSGGSERVLDSFSAMFPDADIFCLWNEAPGRFGDVRVRESILARSPRIGRKALALPAMPAVWKHVDDAGYDWVLSSSHAFAHQVSHGSSIDPERHFSYVHTPARYVWTPELDGRGTSKAARLLAGPLRRIDRARAQEHRNIAANSSYVRDRIQHSWGMDSTVIHPPVEVEKLQSVDDWTSLATADERAILADLPAAFLLGASRFIPYKRLDLVIKTGEAAGLPVVIAGRGPGYAQLVQLAARASVPVRIVHAPSDTLLRALMSRAAAYVFPPIEDFGLMPVEAMALGTPIIVGPIGGALEPVIHGVTGAVFGGEDPRQLARAVDIALATNPEASRLRARDFSVERFASQIEKWMAHDAVRVG